jgi:hypothetical protein
VLEFAVVEASAGDAITTAESTNAALALIMCTLVPPQENWIIEDLHCSLMECLHRNKKKSIRHQCAKRVSKKFASSSVG